MSRPVREPCGCKHDHLRWLELCAKHRAEFEELHVRARSEHQEAAPSVALACAS